MPSSTLRVKIDDLLRFFKIHLIITVLCTVLMLCVLSGGSQRNFITGQAYVWISLISVSLSVYLFFLKKNIALIVGVIVFKWPILIYVVYRLTESTNLEPVGLALGFTPVLLSAFIWSVMQKD